MGKLILTEDELAHARLEHLARDYGCSSVDELVQHALDSGQRAIDQLRAFTENVLLQKPEND